MAEGTKRSLRMRRPPQHFADDNETDGIGYTKQSIAKEYSSPAQEINAIAKILSKFVNSANKFAKESLSSNGNNENILTNKEISNESGKPTVGTHASGRRSTDSEIHASRPYEAVIKSSKPKEPKEPKEAKEPKEPKESKLLKKTPKTNPPNLHLSFENKIDPQRLETLTKMHRLDAHNALLHQQQMLINSNNMYKPHLMPAQQTVSKDSQSKDKLFGRSSYHVAIAYHIHLKNIKESGANISVQSCLLDPTYYAKKLKGEYPDQAAS